jgi:hypothetical protein
MLTGWVRSTSGALRAEGRRLAAVLTGVDVTTPRTRRAIPGIHLHRSRFLDARDTTTHEAIPITTIARTLLDLAATVPERRLERALAQAERLQLYDHRAITDLLARSNGHRGKGALARATRQTPHLTRSELEVGSASSCAERACPSRSGTSSSMPPITEASKSTSTSRRTALLSRPTAGTPTDQGRLQERPPQGRRPHVRRLPRHALHLRGRRLRAGHRRCAAHATLGSGLMCSSVEGMVCGRASPCLLPSAAGATGPSNRTQERPAAAAPPPPARAYVVRRRVGGPAGTYNSACQT